MGTPELMVKVKNDNYGMSLNDYLANYIRSDSEFMDGIRRGMTACKEGKIKPWSEIKENLNIG